MHKLLEVPRRNFARARLTISLARSSPTKGVILVSFAMLDLSLHTQISMDNMHYLCPVELVSFVTL